MSTIKVIHVYLTDDQREAKEKKARNEFDKKVYENFIREPMEQETYDGWGQRSR